MHDWLLGLVLAESPYVSTAICSRHPPGCLLLGLEFGWPTGSQLVCSLPHSRKNWEVRCAQALPPPCPCDSILRDSFNNAYSILSSVIYPFYKIFSIKSIKDQPLVLWSHYNARVAKTCCRSIVPLKGKSQGWLISAMLNKHAMRALRPHLSNKIWWIRV